MADTTVLEDEAALDPARPSTLEASPQARVIGQLEEAGWLASIEKSVSELLEPLLSHPEAPRALDFLHGRWLGHALHPVMSDLPIGLWTGSLLLDMVGARKSAGVLSAAGSAGAVGAAITGIADWTVTDGRERRLGVLHGLLNLSALGLQLASLGARLGRRRRQARTLSVAGWLVATGSAYLGGELVFGRGQMVNHLAWVAGPSTWTPVLPAAELAEGATRKVEVDGRGVLLTRLRGRVRAMEEACAHAGGPLSEGEVRDGVVTCPWHGSQFRLEDGAVVNGPATFPQVRLLTRVRQGQIEVRGR